MINGRGPFPCTCLCSSMLISYLSGALSSDHDKVVIDFVYPSNTFPLESCDDRYFALVLPPGKVKSPIPGTSIT